MPFFDQDQVGLHHFCFRAKCREDVDSIYQFLIGEPDCNIVRSPEDGDHFAPGYYSILFEDPDGIRVEVILSLAKGTSVGREDWLLVAPVHQQYMAKVEFSFSERLAQIFCR